jgi:hypothetical protein
MTSLKFTEETSDLSIITYFLLIIMVYLL